MIKSWLIKKLGGYSQQELREIVAAHVDNLKSLHDSAIADAKVISSENLGAIKRYEQFKLQEVDELADKKLNAMLSSVDFSKIVTLDKRHGIIYIGGQKASEGQLLNLKSEAEYLEHSSIWGMLYENPKELAQRAMFVDSENLDGLKKGRSILYTLSTQKNILDIFKGYVAKK